MPGLSLKRLTVALLPVAMVAAPTDPVPWQDEKQRLVHLMDAFVCLSEGHEFLHIMMGEAEGDPVTAYQEFRLLLSEHGANPELISVRLAFGRITDPSNPGKAGAAELDALVDQLQLACQFGYQGVFKGYGITRDLPTTKKELVPLMREIRGLHDLTELKGMMDKRGRKEGTDELGSR